MCDSLYHLLLFVQEHGIAEDELYSILAYLVASKEVSLNLNIILYCKPS